MSRPQPLVVLSPERIRETAEPILAAQLRDDGPGAMEVWEEQDFDGAHSFEIRVHLREFVCLGTTIDETQIAVAERRRA